MLRKDFVSCKTRNLLSEFMCPITAKANKPRQKFLRQATAGILLLGSLIVTDFGRRIHDDCSYIFYQLKHLLNHLVSPGGDLSPMVKAYRQMTARSIQPDTPIILDFTDSAKPRAKKNVDQAQHALWYYKQRWACEEASRFLKRRVGLKRFRIRRYQAIQRLVILAMFAMGFLTWILLRHKPLTPKIFSYYQPIPNAKVV